MHAMLYILTPIIRHTHHTMIVHTDHKEHILNDRTRRLIKFPMSVMSRYILYITLTARISEKQREKVYSQHLAHALSKHAH